MTDDWPVTMPGDLADMSLRVWGPPEGTTQVPLVWLALSTCVLSRLPVCHNSLPSVSLPDPDKGQGLRQHQPPHQPPPGEQPAHRLRRKRALPPAAGGEGSVTGQPPCPGAAPVVRSPGSSRKMDMKAPETQTAARGLRASSKCPGGKCPSSASFINLF